MQKELIVPTITTVALVALLYFISGFSAAFLCMLLIALEVTLSFDNAVINAKVLEKMSPLWQKRFLTWGMLFAVFGTRCVLPILIVSAIVWQSPLAILSLVISNPTEYGMLLSGAHTAIASFGGIFLLLVALKYFFDDAKEIHWLRRIEERMQKFASFDAVEIAFALMLLLVLASFVPHMAVTILSAGLCGVILFVLMEGMVGYIESREGVLQSSAALFVYLNILDTAFSLDGVVGAFALTTTLSIIVIGLGVGAYWVRAFTLLMVRAKTLSELRYLEHGAHWAIGGLALCMLVSIVAHVPEYITGSIGLFFVVASISSSRKHSKVRA